MHPNQRSGLTLIELLIASASSTLLLGGLCTSIFIASRAIDDSDSGVSSELQSSSVVEDILADLRVARKVISNSSDSIVCVVPDRNGDGVDDVLRYQWSGRAGDPLIRQVNDSPAGEILRDVKSLNFQYFTRTVVGLPEPDVVPSSSLFIRSKEDKETKRKLYADLEIPDEVLPGDLLIASVCVNSDETSNLDSFASSQGWQQIAITSTGYETLGLFYRFAAENEPESYRISYVNRRCTYAFTLAIGGANSTAPIVGLSRSHTGLGADPRANEVNTEDGAMLLRFICTAGDRIKKDYIGVQDHETVALGESDDIGGAAASAISGDDPTAPRAYFALKRPMYFITHSLSLRQAE
ncbi:MAG TPA: hypothetical protein DDW52_29215 [Planctomycetaceae bacterium]|nr:hypothetical protein [Planctomycetaceae bacterium]